MQKIVKYRIFSLVMGIVLTLLAVLMLLDGAGVGDRFFTQGIIHEITAVFVACYVLLVLCPMVPRYNKTVRYFALGEIAVLALTVAGIFFNTVGEIRWIEKMVLFSVVGLVIWLRSAVELINAFTEQAGEQKKQVPLWRPCAYIVTAALGVWQMASPVIGNRYLIFPISILTLLIAGGFIFVAVRGFMAARVQPAVQPVAEVPSTEPTEPAEIAENAESTESAENASEPEAVEAPAEPTEKSE